MTTPTAVQLALQWLHVTYHGLVELASPHPVAEDARTWLFALRTVEQPGYPRTPMLAASLAVPKDGGPPFHPAADDPWGDVAAYTQAPTPRDSVAQARRLNGRGCVVSVAAGMAGGPATPLPWQPAHEAPGWWELLLRRYFGSAEQLRCASWDEVVRRIRETGSGTRGVVWVRRAVGGLEASGHLIHAHNQGGEAVFLDGMTGGLARLDTLGVHELVLARVRPGPSASLPGAAPDLDAAVSKAEAWLRRTYEEPVRLVDPGPADEMTRGWLFACNTEAYLDGSTTHDMLDAALVVPKAAGAEPFHLPNSRPWPWLEAWDGGAEPAAAEEGIGLPPAPGAAAWLPDIMRQLGTEPLSSSEHRVWETLLDEVGTWPVGARGLVRVHRVDRRGRESVGLLLTAYRSEAGTGVIDGSPDPITDLNEVAASGFRLVRYR